MTETIRFDGVSLPVSDVDRSVAFYQQFGFELQILGQRILPLPMHINLCRGI